MALATQSNRIKIGIRPTIDGRRMGVRESLETQTIRMAQSVAQLLQTHIRHTDGTFVECVVADSTIGGVAEAAACADKFKRENVGLTITVTPCWCYGSETIDMDPHMPKAIWGFNGTERPGAVYLAAALAGHSQLGLPAFSIYGTEVQEADDTNIPEDVKEKLLRFARAGLAVASIRGKSYLSIGSVSMGIAGSIVNQAFFQEYLGMRNEYVDMMEIKRRLDRKIYDQEEVDLALSWVKQYCKEGVDVNSLENQRNAEERAELWENVVKMTIITRDLMVGNPKLATLNYAEDVHNKLNQRTNETWPTTWFVPRLTGKGAFTDVYSVMANWGANHCVATHGHVGADLITLASMLRIPVCMHNVSEKNIFRPSAWNGFGQDKEGQDYRACQNFGPLYK